MMPSKTKQNTLNDLVNIAIEKHRYCSEKQAQLHESVSNMIIMTTEQDLLRVFLSNNDCYPFHPFSSFPFLSISLCSFLLNLTIVIRIILIF